MAQNPEIEHKLIENPDDVDTYLVYADFLQSQGDPRGELIVLHQQGKQAEAEALLEKHAEHFYGDFNHYRHTLEGDEQPAFDWHLGFIRSARLGYDSNEGEDDETLPMVLTALLRHPSGALLRDITISINMLDDGGYFEPVLQVLGSVGAPCLRSLRVGEFSNAGGPGGEGDYVYEISWTSIGDASSLWKGVPRLEKLVIQSGLGSTSASSDNDDRFGDIQLPRLKYFEAITGAMSQHCIQSLAAAKWPELETLKIWFGSSDYGFSGGIDDIQPILDARGLPKLKYLGLMNAEFTDDVIEPLIRSRILPQLEVLDLSYGTMTDEGAQRIAANKAAFAHLEQLKLAQNCIFNAPALWAQVDTSDQKDEDERYVALAE